MAALDLPSAISASTSRSRAVSDSISAVRRLPRQLGDHLGVEGGAAGGDPGQRLGELGGVGDAVLEQIADARGARGQQPGREPGLDVLGEEQHAGAGVLPADVDRGPQAFVAVGGRHPDIDDGDVGPVLGDGGAQRVGVRDGGADLVPALGKHLGEQLPQYGGILGDHDAHGPHALTASGSRRGFTRAGGVRSPPRSGRPQGC
jgi:hypothetical protein